MKILGKKIEVPNESQIVCLGILYYSNAGDLRPLILSRLQVVLVDLCFTLQPNAVPQFEFLESCFCLCAAVVF